MEHSSTLIRHVIKKSGPGKGVRIVYEPKPEWKAWYQQIFEDCRHSFAYDSPYSVGAIPGRAFQDSLKSLAGFTVSVNEDIASFFPSITVNLAQDSLKRFTSVPSETLQDVVDYGFVYEKGKLGLAQGVPFASFVSEAVGGSLDGIVVTCLRRAVNDLIAQKYLLSPDSRQKIAQAIDRRGVFSYQYGPLFQGIEMTRELTDVNIAGVDIRYARYVDNLAVFIRIDKIDDSERSRLMRKRLYLGLVRQARRCLRYAMSVLGLEPNPRKSHCNWNVGSSPMLFVGVKVNVKSRARKDYVERLRTELHHYGSYLEDCHQGRAFFTRSRTSVKRLVGKSAWVLSCNPRETRIIKPLSRIIYFEDILAKNNIPKQLQRYVTENPQHQWAPENHDTTSATTSEAPSAGVVEGVTQSGSVPAFARSIVRRNTTQSVRANEQNG